MPRKAVSRLAPSRSAKASTAGGTSEPGWVQDGMSVSSWKWACAATPLAKATSDGDSRAPEIQAAALPGLPSGSGRDRASAPRAVGSSRADTASPSVSSRHISALSRTGGAISRAAKSPRYSPIMFAADAMVGFLLPGSFQLPPRL